MPDNRQLKAAVASRASIESKPPPGPAVEPVTSKTETPAARRRRERRAHLQANVVLAVESIPTTTANNNEMIAIQVSRIVTIARDEAMRAELPTERTQLENLTDEPSGLNMFIDLARHRVSTVLSELYQKGLRTDVVLGETFMAQEYADAHGGQLTAEDAAIIKTAMQERRAFARSCRNRVLRERAEKQLEKLDVEEMLNHGASAYDFWYGHTARDAAEGTGTGSAFAFGTYDSKY